MFFLGLNEDISKYYYQIKIQEKDNNYFYIQAFNTEEYLSVSHSSIHYTISNNYNGFINYIPLKKIDNNMTFINYYGEEFQAFINIASRKDELFMRNIDNFIKLKPEIKQINDTNKIEIKMNSLSYHFYPNKYKYIFITNLHYDFAK